jgi:hypothetical protein
MAILKKKEETVKISFQCDTETAKKLKEIEEKSAKKGFDFDLDFQMRKALVRVLTAAEKELKE